MNLTNIPFISILTQERRKLGKRIENNVVSATFKWLYISSHLGVDILYFNLTVDRHRLPNCTVTNDYNHSTDLWSMLCFFNYNKRCGLSPVYFFGFYTFETSKIIPVDTILVFDIGIFTHLKLLKPKPVHGIIKSKQDNSSSQALHDTPRVGCTTRACRSYTYPDSPTVVYVNTKGEVEKADTVPRTQARWREEDQLGSSLGVTRPTPLASTQTHVNLEMSLVGIFIVIPVTTFPNQKLWHHLHVVLDGMVSLLSLRMILRFPRNLGKDICSFNNGKRISTSFSGIGGLLCGKPQTNLNQEQKNITNYETSRENLYGVGSPIIPTVWRILGGFAVVAFLGGLIGIWGFTLYDLGYRYIGFIILICGGYIACCGVLNAFFPWLPLSGWWRLLL